SRSGISDNRACSDGPRHAHCPREVELETSALRSEASPRSCRSYRDNSWKLASRSKAVSVGGLFHCGRCRLLALRVISLRREVRSLSGHSGHGRACCWLELGRE